MSCLSRSAQSVSWSMMKPQPQGSRKLGSCQPVWVPGQGETAGFHHRSIARALKAGLTYRPLSQTAGDTLAWFKTQPPERQAKLRSGLTPERETALLAQWKASGGKG